MRRYAALILLIGLAMTAVGCAGGGGASWFFFMAVLLSANLTLMACGTDDGDGSGRHRCEEKGDERQRLAVVRLRSFLKFVCGFFRRFILTQSCWIQY